MGAYHYIFDQGVYSNHQNTHCNVLPIGGSPPSTPASLHASMSLASELGCSLYGDWTAPDKMVFPNVPRKLVCRRARLACQLPSMLVCMTFAGQTTRRTI